MQYTHVPAFDRTSEMHLPKPKPWGETRLLFRDYTHEVWHASIRAGGHSSVHHHTRVPNQFYVVSGDLDVCFYKADPGVSGFALARTQTLRRGDSLVVPENVIHSFLARTDVELIETYWARLMPGEDIVRHSTSPHGAAPRG